MDTKLFLEFALIVLLTSLGDFNGEYVAKPSNFFNSNSNYVNGFSFGVV